MKNQFLVDVQYILKYEVLSHEHQFFFNLALTITTYHTSWS